MKQTTLIVVIVIAIAVIGVCWYIVSCDQSTTEGFTNMPLGAVGPEFGGLAACLDECANRSPDSHLTVGGDFLCGYACRVKYSDRNRRPDLTPDAGREENTLGTGELDRSGERRSIDPVDVSVMDRCRSSCGSGSLQTEQCMSECSHEGVCLNRCSVECQHSPEAKGGVKPYYCMNTCMNSCSGLGYMQ